MPSLECGCLWWFLSSNLWPTIQTLFIYLLFVLSLVGYELIFGPIGSVSELDYEIKGFIKSYKKSSWWWLTSFIASISALTIGAQDEIILNLVILAMFFSPALMFFHKYYPFSLKCRHRADHPSQVGRESPEGGSYAIELVVTVGTNIEDLSIELETPQGVVAKGIQPPPNLNIELKREKLISGEAPPGEDEVVIYLFLEETTGVGPGGNFLILTDENSGRQLTTIRLLPD